MAERMLHDRRVLVVEDEYLIAQAVERGLRRAGAIVLGPVPNVASALALLQREPDVDAAVLDINLGEHKVYPVVDALLARGAHCVFATGNDAVDVPAAYAAITRCEKPIDPVCLVQALNPTTDVAEVPAEPERSHALRTQLLALIDEADRTGRTLLAAKLCEALDVVD